MVLPIQVDERATWPYRSHNPHKHSIQLESAALPAVEVDILQNIAIILGSLGNYAEGLEYGFKALHLVQSIGDRDREAHILSSIGVIYHHSKNIDESLRMFRQALQLNRELGGKRYEAQTLNNMSLSLNALGDHEEALVTSLEALPAWQRKPSFQVSS